VRDSRKDDFGDWQTPPLLGKAVFSVLEGPFSSILEPTCGKGAFLMEAVDHFPEAQILGIEISPEYVAVSQEISGVEVRQGDFFLQDWESILARMPEPVLIVGNPPWVTVSSGTSNVPKKSSKGMKGLEAKLGKSNFDIAESIIETLLKAGQGRNLTLAMLCKTTVARKLFENHSSLNGEIRHFDSEAFWNVSVDAVLLIVKPGEGFSKWPVFADLQEDEPSGEWVLEKGKVRVDTPQLKESSVFLGETKFVWRSGIKHDCSKVFELRQTEEGFENGFGDVVLLEGEYVYPLAKGSDVANGRVSRKKILVPQKSLSQEEELPPKVWGYLDRNRTALEARKSSIYKGDFSIFGVGDYSFAPYKVAICGMYHKVVFTLLSPQGGMPTMVDDTCYFLAFEDRADAERVRGVLERHKGFFEARMFGGSKRPITKDLLQTFSIELAS